MGTKLIKTLYFRNNIPSILLINAINNKFVYCLTIK